MIPSESKDSEFEIISLSQNSIKEVISTLILLKGLGGNENQQRQKIGKYVILYILCYMVVTLW